MSKGTPKNGINKGWFKQGHHLGTGIKRPDMLGDKNPARQPGVGAKISEGKARAKGWITRTPGYYSFQEKQRKIRKRMNGGSHTLMEWELLKAQYNYTCPCCGLSEPEIKLTEDHIIPLIKGGSNNIENLQPLCNHCNSKKGINTIKY